jgi:tetratricopeptide (TPR) repeat protein
VKTALVAALLLAAPAFAQVPQFTVPDPSPAAKVEQRVGITDIAISYHRPGVNNRKVWGALVPYGQVWRAGANENTVISFSSPVSVEGHKLAAGSYGLHMLPTASSWTIIFSSVTSAWGSFSYDEKEDALRVTVSPEESPAVERLEYSFDNPTDKSAVVALRWAGLRVPFRVEVDTPQIVVASLRSQLRGLPRFGWRGWAEAAAYCNRANVNLDEAMQWIDRSIGMQAAFGNQLIKAGLLDKKGDADGARALREKALAIGNENEINVYGYQLMGEGKKDEAIAIFQRNVKAHPESWNVYDSLGEAYANTGNKQAAMENYSRAREMAKDPAQRTRIEGVLAELRK